jgi:hypothetical protein
MKLFGLIPLVASLIERFVNRPAQAAPTSDAAKKAQERWNASKPK